jgi:NADPH:quinone reductase-like Zn-dependent oxidoreductase
MRAAVFSEYGPPEVLHVAEAPRPVPRGGDVLVRVHATSVSFGDTLVRNFRSVSPRQFHMPLLWWLIGRAVFGFRRPRKHVLGSEFAGEVAAVGANVTRYKVGDRVFGFRGPKMGAYAEYLCVPEKAVMAPMPGNVTFEDAATVPYGAIMAWGLLRKIGVRSGQRVLVVGASGGIGPAVVQLAVRQFGAVVTGVCGPANVDYVQSLGATTVIDYTKDDFRHGDATFDVIVDILGATAFGDGTRVLAEGGQLVYVSFKMRQVAEMVWTSIVRGKRVRCVLVSEKPKDLDAIRGFVENGLLRPRVDKVFPLEQAAEAHRYAESEARCGPVVIRVAE